MSILEVYLVNGALARARDLVTIIRRKMCLTFNRVIPL